MIRFENGKIDLSVLELTDLIDARLLQRFLDDFAIGMNCAAIAVDRKGQEVTKPSHYRDFCNKFIHESPIGDKRCAECHKNMGIEAMKQKKAYVGQCHAGLIDFAAPVIVDGEHIGTILGGQILMEPMKQEQAQRVSRELNLDPDRLWKASESIDVVPKTMIDAAASVLYIVVNSLAEEGFRRIETEHLTANLIENFLQISTTIEELAESAQEITGNQQKLTANIQLINQTTEEVSEILKSITRVTDKTKLIGLNASIEAARLGNVGRGFAIVANEIRMLSEQTKETANNINDLNKSISTTVSETIQHADATLEVTENQSAAMEELTATVQNLVEYAERLKTLFQ